MTASNIRKKLASGESIFGLFTPVAQPKQAELLALLGFDFLIFDGEHGEIEPADTPGLAFACQSNDCSPFIRVPSTDPRVIGRHLDFGAAGIVAPMVNSKSDAESVLSAALYPPIGGRGLAQTRHLNFGLVDDIPYKLEQANADVLIIAQIETREAIEHLDEILTLDRLDILFVGPADLSSSLGVPMQFDHPDFQSAMMTIATKVCSSGKHLGVLVAQPEQIKMLHALGFRMFAGYLDLMIAVSGRTFLQSCRSITFFSEPA